MKYFLSLIFSLLLSASAIANDNGLNSQIQQEIEQKRDYLSSNVFDTQLPTNNHYKSVVFLYQKESFMETGSIASGAFLENNRIITAKHVVQNSCHHPINIFDYKGNYIGKISTCIPKENIAMLNDFVRQDFIVLPILDYQHHDEIPTQLASKSRSFQINRENPIISEGLSGAPAFNNRDEVIGVVSMMTPMEKPEHTIFILQRTHNKILRLVKDGQTYIDDLTINNILNKKVYHQAKLFIAPDTNNYIDTLKLTDIIGFSNGIGVIIRK